MIKSIAIDVLDKGFTLSAGDQRFGFSTLDDLLIGISDVLDPESSTPICVGIDLADPASDTAVERIDRPDGTSSTTWTKRDGSSETLEDDGWREWDGHLNGREYPPGVERLTAVQILLKRGNSQAGCAHAFEWRHEDADYDIVRYRVVRP